MSVWIGIGVVVAALATAGAIYQARGSARDRRMIRPPGRMVSVGTHRLHVVEAGPASEGFLRSAPDGAPVEMTREEESGSPGEKTQQEKSDASVEIIRGKKDCLPTVVFEAALGASSISWALVQPEIAKLTRTFAYDRAGMGFSESGPEPRTAGRIVEEMHLVLEASGARKPYALVGHSYGGMTCRLFAARYPEEVAGMVLLDPADAEMWSKPTREQRWKLRAGAMLARRGALVAQLGIARMTAALARRGARRSARATAAVVSGGILAGRSEKIIAPVEQVPVQFRPMLATFWTQARFYRSLASQIQHMTQSAAEVARETMREDMPLTVLSAASMPKEEMEGNRALAARSSRGKHEVVEGSGHWVQLDQPEVVLRAVREMVEEVASSE